ncbi:MAG TPA: hypothetical protein DD982_09200 [Thalassospira sp.]|nr:hypothetical protein [Thalassospira sp.]HBS22686.1 hypothetical protein [Thalassospira sp.]|tara:strand:+ start:97 stop:600 length:504 start_codon:yes stop_codon:yes gene_type:complete
MYIGFFIGILAGNDIPSIRQKVDWETLLAGSTAIIGGWFAYRGAVTPFKEARKSELLQFQYNVKKAGAGVCSVLGCANLGLDSGLHGIFPDRKESEEEQFRAYAQEFMDNMPEIPPRIMNLELLEIYKDLEFSLLAASSCPDWNLMRAIDHVLPEMEKFDKYISENT